MPVLEANGVQPRVHDDWDAEAERFVDLMQRLSRNDRINLLACKFRLIEAMGDARRLLGEMFR